MTKSKAPAHKCAIHRNLLVAALGFWMSANAGAQGTGTGWQFELTPYVWGTAMKGTVQAGNLPQTRVDMSVSDILDVLDFAAFGTLEARKGKWGLLFDAIYFKVSDSATATRTGPGPIGATLTATANATITQSMFAAALAYRISEGVTPIDLVGGLRYSKIDVDANIEASLFGLTGFRARSGDKDWVDPYVGVRVQHALSDRWTLMGYADIGGFGVGSDFAWQAIAGVNYRFSNAVSFKFGYRAMDIDYDSGGFRYDMRTQGLYLGAGFRF